MIRDWPLVRLGDVLDGTPRNGISPATSGTVEERVLTLSSVTGTEFDATASKIGRFELSPPKNQRVNSSDLLVCRGNGNLKLVGRGFFPNEDRSDLVFPDTIIAVRVKRDRVHLRYLEYIWNSPTVRVQIERQARTTNGAHKINQEILRNVNFPLPPIEDQRWIAKVLDRMAALRAKRRAAIALLDDLAQSIFVDMFGDRREIFKNWPSKNLGSLLTFLTSGSRGWAKYYTDVPGDKFLRIQNVRNNELVLEDIAYVNAPHTAEARRTLVQSGDVLLSITADLGRTAVIPDGLGRAFINQHLSVLRTSAIEPKYLSAYLASPSGQNQILRRNRQGVKAGLNFDDIRSFEIPVPPREIQRDFMERVQVANSLLEASRTHRDQLDDLFGSLQQRAFRGELWQA